MRGGQAGFAQELFVRWADNPRNLVLFTSRPDPGTLGRRLHDEPTLASVRVTLHPRPSYRRGC